MKKYDIILYGATGFTGSRAVAYFKQNAPAALRWAIAGRSQSKLESLKKELHLQQDILVADALNAQQIEKMVGQTKVILTTAGPYDWYGSLLLGSCAKQGVHYVDITGETPWVAEMLQAYGKLAKETGAKIINFCGFDSIPADLGVWVLGKKMQEAYQSPLVAARGYYTLIGGGLNGGTLLSALNMMEKGEGARVKNPKLLLSDLEHRDFISKIKNKQNNHLSKDINKWVYPFVMGDINTKVVYRSIGLTSNIAQNPKHPFLYQEYHAIGKRFSSTTAHASMMAFAVLGQFGIMRKLIRKLGPKANQGPSTKQIEEGFFKLVIFGEDSQNNKAKTTLKFEGDAGNKATITFLCQTAFALVLDEDRLPKHRGFLTPSFALGQVLEDRLTAAGLSIKTVLV